MYLKKRSLTNLICLFFPFVVFSQTDTSVQRKISYLKEQYETQIENQSGYLSGKAYTFQYPNYQNSPFYSADVWAPCTLYHGTESFNHKFIKYDLHNDVLVCLLFTTEGPKYIELNSRYILEFIIDNHHFKFLEFPTVDNKKIQPKYYEIISEGNVCLYKSWQKSNIKPTDKTFGQFDEFYRYIVVVNNKAFEIDSKETLERALNDSQFMSDKTLEVGKKFESQLYTIINLYNSK